MAIVNIASSTDFSKVAGIFGNSSLRVQPGYSYYSVPSATASGAIATVAGVLHSIIFQATATAGTAFWLFDSAGTAGAIGTSASAVARFDLTSVTRGTYLFDCIFNNGLTYRMSATEGTDGITVTYTTGGFTA